MLLRFGIAAIWAITLSFIAFKIQRHDTVFLFSSYAFAFIAYLFVLVKTKNEADADFYFQLSIVLRGVFVFSFPALSDDIYRFIWDGRLTNLGISPFAYPPQYFIDNQLFTPDLTPQLFASLNSPNYYSVYPSVCQGVFALATYLFPKSIYGAAVMIKAFLLICEISTLFLIKKLTTNSHQPSAISHQLSVISYQLSAISYQQSVLNVHYPVLIYALNPLILIELNANAHFEAAMIFFFMATIYGLFHSFPSNSNVGKAKYPLAVFAWALSISTKMLPLLFMPLLWKYTGWKKSIVLGLLSLLFLGLLFLPIYNSLLIYNLSQSLNLYFSKFEFNASFYYLLRELGLWYFGYNPITHITRLFAIIVLAFITKKTFFEKPTHNNSQFSIFNSQFSTDCLFILCLYFLTATTVHPWYAAFPLALASLTYWRFPIVWTGLILLTYAGYTEGSSKHAENYVLVVVEYVLTIGFFVYEWRTTKASNT
jgi:alpha-1,6-mannosyltransferase